MGLLSRSAAIVIGHQPRLLEVQSELVKPLSE